MGRARSGSRSIYGNAVRFPMCPEAEMAGLVGDRAGMVACRLHGFGSEYVKQLGQVGGTGTRRRTAAAACRHSRLLYCWSVNKCRRQPWSQPLLVERSPSRPTIPACPMCAEGPRTSIDPIESDEQPNTRPVDLARFGVLKRVGQSSRQDSQCHEHEYNKQKHGGAPRRLSGVQAYECPPPFTCNCACCVL